MSVRMASVDRRERERQEMRDLILAAAMKLFLEESFEKTTMRRIAEAIEYTPGALYSYFKDKDEILYALHQRGFDVLLEMLSTVAAAHPEPIGRLRKLGETYLEFACTQPQYYDLMFIASSTARTIAERAEWAPGLAAYAILRQAVADCAAAGRLPAGVDIDDVTLASWAGVHGLAALHLRGRLIMIDDKDRQRAIRSALLWLGPVVPDRAR
jgi:AcrR family transcriptional regulator